MKWCRDAELNCGHADFQSAALPTELSRHNDVTTMRIAYVYFFKQILCNRLLKVKQKMSS